MDWFAKYRPTLADGSPADAKAAVQIYVNYPEANFGQRPLACQQRYRDIVATYKNVHDAPTPETVMASAAFPVEMTGATLLIVSEDRPKIRGGYAIRAYQAYDVGQVDAKAPVQRTWKIAAGEHQNPSVKCLIDSSFSYFKQIKLDVMPDKKPW